ncbi:MAG: DUF1667 domain-containing protein [Clostridia bacterium]|nr:DUF1667 domain-containing protein [Clostridia bacterium]
MSVRSLTCIECPIGCSIEVTVENGEPVSVTGNACPRGKLYAENEVICPRRVLTSTVRAENGELIPVKTDKPIKKDETFDLMKKINRVVCKLPVKIGDIIVENITEDINLIATGNAEGV